MSFPALSNSLIETECGKIVDVPCCFTFVWAGLADAYYFASAGFLLDGDPGSDSGYR